MQHLLALPGVRRESFPARMFGAERTHFSKLDVNCGIRKMYRFFHEETNKTITLFESIDSSPLVPILFFHSSVLMNYVDAREVVSFYSSLTEDSIGLANDHPRFDLIHKPGLRSKWLARGVETGADCSTLHSVHAAGTSGINVATCQRAYRRTDDLWMTRLAFEGGTRRTVKPVLSWQLGRRAVAHGREGLQPGTVHASDDNWHMRTFKREGLWVEYYAPLDPTTGEVVGAWWRRCFP
ncbi:hypothetical protein D9611_010239 [Ephemerocybe angulata]|uniref:Uncharacterized protein n=1 Tax=Ephemerocybe angulata TaxID=980116 RepID=A0A8H5AZW7_9AGAR|nr:hypothetical protein D9611_010239 [Tulosesus angulatus]